MSNMPNSIFLTQGSSIITITTDGADLSAPISSRQVFLNNLIATKITINFSDGTAFYLTDFSEPSTFSGGSSEYESVLGVASVADVGFDNSVNVIPGYGYLASFDLYDANTNTLLADNLRPSMAGIGSTNPFAPAVTFEEVGGTLVVQNYVGSAMNSYTQTSVNNDGALSFSGAGIPYARTTLATYTLSGYTPVDFGTANPEYIYIGGFSAISLTVNGSMSNGASNFLSTIDALASVQLSSGLIGSLGSLSKLITVNSLVSLSYSSAKTTFATKDVLPLQVLDAGVISDILSKQGVSSNMVNYLFASDFSGQGTIAVSNNKHSNFVDVLVSNGTSRNENTPLDLWGFKGIAITGLGVDVVNITAANDVIGAGNASYVMSSGNESMVLNGINSQVDGGSGVDTVVMQGASKTGAIVTFLNSDQVQLWSGGTSGTGVNILTNIERIEFKNGAIALDTANNEHAGQAYLLYGVFNRAPDEVGLGYWIDALDNGQSTNSIAQAFISSNEFMDANGNNLSSIAFISVLYQNILHRTADASGLEYWNKELQGSDNNAHRASILEGFAFSDEHVGLVGSLLSKGVDYQVYSA